MSGPELRVDTKVRSIAGPYSRILLVDDTEANLAAFESVLEGVADFVVRAGSGQQALAALLTEAEFAVVLLDVRMSDMSGFEVATLIRNQRRLKGLPIVFITAFEPSRKELEQAYGFGAVDFIVKPVSPVVLRSKVAVFVELYRSRTELERRVAERTEDLRRSEEGLARKLAATQKLQDISTQLIREGDTRALQEKILDAAVAIMGSGMATMQIVDEKEDALRLLAFRGFEPEFGKIFEFVRPGTRTACCKAWREGRRVIMSDVETCDFIVGTPELEAHRKVGIRGVQSTPLISRSGKLLGMISTHWRQPHTPSGEDLSLLDVLARQAADLLERSQAESALRQLNASLEGLVEHRTADLKNTVQELDSFAYSIAHDLRAPLRAIHGCSFILLEDHAGKLDPNGRDLAERIAAAGKRMDVLISDLLSYCHLSRQELPLSRLSIHTTVNGVLRDMEQELKPVGTQVEVNETSFDVLGNEPTLRQAMSNLISNATKFIAPGVPPRIRIRAEKKGDRVRLWVEDNGIGIDPTDVPRLFKVFERLHPTHAYPGTGIGLAIVRRVMDRMGGSVGVDSTPGEGSRFWIELPAAVGGSPA